MKKLGAALFAAFVCGPALLAQEMSPRQVAALDSITIWKVANTLLFAAGLGWALWKYAPGFFNARSADIQKAIKDATGLKIDADFRYSEIDKRMANLPAEKKKLEEQAAAELEREHERILDETEEELEHIRRHVEAEREALRAEGRRQIRQRTVEQALALAERRLAERFASGEPQELTQDFVNLVERGHN